MCRLRLFAAIAILAVVSGCASASATPPPVPVAEPAIGFAVDPVAPGLQPFPECQTDEYAFVGEASLAAIGLGQIAGGAEANRVGMIWVTANPVVMPQPQPIGGGNVPNVEADRFVCVQWADGSGMGSTVPDDWVPPADVASAGATQSEPQVPLGTLAVIVGALVLIGFSIVAFRSEGSPAAREPTSL
jgi:hypothetical protein